MRAQVGDELTVKGRHQGDEDRHGEIVAVVCDGSSPVAARLHLPPGPGNP
jgi:Domain of unknown function (DUF1918)